MWEDIKEIAIAIIIVLLCGFFLFWSVSFAFYKYDVEILSANIVEIFVDNIKTYEGKKAFVNIDSGGMTTTLTIYKKLYPFPIIKETYSNSNVIVKPIHLPRWKE